MEGPVKERLTGALILVAALVIVVPEMLSGPDAISRPEAADAAQPADAGPPLRTYSLVLDSGDEAKPVGQATLAPQSSAQIAAVAAPAAQPEPASKPPPQTAAPAPPPAAPPPATVVQQAAPQAGQWWAQLGSFSARDNAERLAQQLRSAGFEVDVSRINAGGKELHRVRAGPVRDRPAALALQARLAEGGHKASLVAP